MSFAPMGIQALLALARQEDASAFTARLGLGALVGTPPAAEAEGAWSFHTTVQRATFSRALPGIDLVSAVVIPLRKVQRAFPDTLLVGRAASNDVCIDEPSISKLHARIRIDGDRLWLRDAGSRNGIEVNYAKRTEEHPLREGDVVTLGHWMFRFNTPARLWEMLRAVV